MSIGNLTSIGKSKDSGSSKVDVYLSTWHIVYQSPTYTHKFTVMIPTSFDATPSNTNDTSTSNFKNCIGNNVGNITYCLLPGIHKGEDNTTIYMMSIDNNILKMEISGRSNILNDSLLSDKETLNVIFLRSGKIIQG